MKSVRQRKTKTVLSLICRIQKNKNKKQLIDTESRLVAVSGRDLKVEDMGKEGQMVKRYKKF